MKLYIAGVGLLSTLGVITYEIALQLQASMNELFAITIK